jgi:hypothetical protein
MSLKQILPYLYNQFNQVNRDNASKERAIGMLQLGATQGDVARWFRAARKHHLEIVEQV